MSRRLFKNTSCSWAPCELSPAPGCCQSDFSIGQGLGAARVDLEDPGISISTTAESCCLAGAALGSRCSRTRPWRSCPHGLVGVAMQARIEERGCGTVVFKLLRSPIIDWLPQG